jgi:hypothetical protein
MRRPLEGMILLLASVALVATSCGGSSSSTSTTSSQAASGTAFAIPAPIVPFGLYVPVPATSSSAAYAGPSTPTSLANVDLAPSEKAELKQVPALGPILEKQGFGVVRSGSSLFQSEYEGNIYGGFPVYVTTDAAYNSFHLVFDKTLRDLEQKVLLPKLSLLVASLLQDAHAQTAGLGSSPVGGSAAKVEQLYEVAAAELGQKVALGPLAKAEKALIDAHDQTTTSPIVGGQVDYSLFTPRGHYALTPALTRFFVAMSVLGQIPFCLPATTSCPGSEPTRMGILASLALAGNSKDRALWQQVYEPTAFLVGLADDYTPDEVAAAVKKAAPAVLAPGGLKSLRSDAEVGKIADALVAARKVRINPSAASIRIMGTRFVTDELLLQNLVYPHVGTAARPRTLPLAVDLASAFGGQFSAKVMKAKGAPTYANYVSQMQADQQAVAKRPAEQWGSTVYDAWLYALQPMFTPHGSAFPDYMRSDAWSAKDLQSGLGSYTELKHDTILFAKQLVAEAGGDFSNRNPLNWVEPDPVAFERLAAGADLMKRGLARRGLLTHESAGLLGTEIGLLRFLGTTARAELAGTPISAAANKRLRSVGDALSAIWWRTSERSNPDPSIPDQSAVVADIATSPNAILELGTGEVQTIYVLVPGRNGTFELARGGVYSYYEFTTPPAERLTDAQWRAMLATGTTPAPPGWEAAFRVPCPHASQACSPSYLPG